MAVHLEKSHTFGPTTPTTRDITIGDLLKEAAKECPDQLAIITGVNETTPLAVSAIFYLLILLQLVGLLVVVELQS